MYKRTLKLKCDILYCRLISNHLISNPTCWTIYICNLSLTVQMHTEGRECARLLDNISKDRPLASQFRPDIANHLAFLGAYAGLFGAQANGNNRYLRITRAIVKKAELK